MTAAPPTRRRGPSLARTPRAREPLSARRWILDLSAMLLLFTVPILVLWPLFGGARFFVAAYGALAIGLALAAARTLPDEAVLVELDPQRHRTIGLIAMATANESPQVRLARRLLASIDGTCWGLTPVGQ